MTLRLLASLALAVLLGAAPVHAARDPALMRAIGLLERGDVEGAVSALDPVVRQLSRDPQARAELAQAYLHLGIAHSLLNAEYTARGAMREALRLDPSLTLDPDRWPPKVQRLFAAVRAETPGLAGAAATPAAPPAATGSDDEAFLAFARKAEQTVAAWDASFLNAAMDFDTLLDTSMRGLPASPELSARFRSGMKAVGLGTTVVEEMKKGGSYRFLVVRRGNGPPHVLFRWLLANGGLNYQKLAVQRDATGAVRVVDSYVFSYGEWASVFARRSWLDSLAAAGATKGLGLSGFDADYVSSLSEINNVQKLKTDGRAAAALDALLKLPASLQSAVGALAARVEIAKGVDEARYTEAVDAFARRAAVEPELNLQLQEAYWSRGQFALALASLEGLRRAVGTDAYLDYLRGNALYNRTDARDVAGAKQAYQQAIAREPFLPQPHDALLRVSLAEKSYADTARLLADYEPYAAKGAIETLIASADYAGFVASNEYRRWQAARPAGSSSSAPPAPAAPGPAAPAARATPPSARVPQLPPESWQVFRVDPTTGALLPLERATARKKGLAKVGLGKTYCYLDGARSPAAYRRGEALVFAVRHEGSSKDPQAWRANLDRTITDVYKLERLFVSEDGRRYATKSYLPLAVEPYGGDISGVDTKRKDSVGRAYLLKPTASLVPGEYALAWGGMLADERCEGQKPAFSIVE